MTKDDLKMNLIDPFEFEDIPWDIGKDLYTYWQTLKNGRSMPSRKDINPADIPRLLPHLGIIELTDQDPDTLKIRLVGTALTHHLGKELTGVRIKDLTNNSEMFNRCKWLVENKRPYLSLASKLTWSEKEHKEYGVIGLPLSADDETVNMILVSLVFKPSEVNLFS